MIPMLLHRRNLPLQHPLRVNPHYALYAPLGRSRQGRHAPAFCMTFVFTSRQRTPNTMEAAALAYLAAGLGAGLATIGAAYGIGRLADSAMDGAARQPEAAGDIRGLMIVSAGLIEGVALFSVIICLLLVLFA